jgi:hypothetical protein
MKQVIIPVAVIASITDWVVLNHPTITEKQKTKFVKTLCTIWWVIYEKQTTTPFYYQHHNPHMVFAEINSRYLLKWQVKLGSRQLFYNRLIDILQELELVDVNEQYSTGRFSKSYRPNPNIDYSEITEIQLNLDKFFESVKTEQQLINLWPNEEKLISDLFLTTVDLKGLHQTLIDTIGKPYKLQWNSWYTKCWDKILTPRLAYSILRQALRVNLGIHFFYRDDRGRCHTTISNLSKLAVPHLQLNGKPVKGIDAANCQPLIMSSFFNLPDFQSACEQGEFHNRMAESLQITREEWKGRVWQIMFSNNELTTKVYQALEREFPGLADAINSTKQALPGQELWWRLQSAESDIFIETALKYKSGPVLTRHDEILCNEEDEQELRRLLKQEFDNQLGLNVTLK